MIQNFIAAGNRINKAIRPSRPSLRLPFFSCSLDWQLGVGMARSGSFYRPRTERMQNCFLLHFSLTSPHRVFTESPAKWLVAYGHVYSLLMDMNSLYLVSTRSEDIVAKFSLPPFRRSVRGSNFTPGESAWLNGLHTRPRESLVFATSMPDYSVLLLKLKEGTWPNVEPITGTPIITRTAWVRVFVRSVHHFFRGCHSHRSKNIR